MTFAFETLDYSPIFTRLEVPKICTVTRKSGWSIFRFPVKTVHITFKILF